MDLEDIVEEMKEVGASEDAIRTCLDELDISHSKQDELLGYESQASSSAYANSIEMLFDYGYWF